MVEKWSKFGPEIPSQIAFKYPKHLFEAVQIRNPHQQQMGRPSIHADDIVLSQKLQPSNPRGRHPRGLGRPSRKVRGEAPHLSGVPGVSGNLARYSQASMVAGPLKKSGFSKDSNFGPIVGRILMGKISKSVPGRPTASRRPILRPSPLEIGQNQVQTCFLTKTCLLKGPDTITDSNNTVPGVSGNLARYPQASMVAGPLRNQVMIRECSFGPDVGQFPMGKVSKSVSGQPKAGCRC